MIARHNRHVALVSIWAILSVAVLWIVVYFAFYGLVLLCLTLGNPLNTTPPSTFPIRFGIFAALFFGTVFLERRIAPHRRLRDKATTFENAMDILLALPRATITGLENLRAFLFLNPRERETAWALLRLLQEHRRLSLTELPQEFPNEPLRLRIIHALQILDLIELRERDGDWLIALRGTEEANRLMSKTFRLKRGW